MLHTQRKFSQSNSKENLLKNAFNLDPESVPAISKALEGRHHNRLGMLSEDNCTIRRNEDNRSMTNKNNQSKKKKVTLNSHDLVDYLRSYNEKFNANKKLFKIKQEENEEFLKQYHRVTTQFKENGAKFSNPEGTEVAFKDLITEYKKRNYKIPDFSVKRNIFNPSALLEANSKLEQFFNYINLAKGEHAAEKDKSLKFLHALEERLTEVIANDRPKTRGSSMEQNQQAQLAEEKLIEENEEKERLKEIKKTMSEIQRMNKTFSEMKEISEAALLGETEKRKKVVKFADSGSSPFKEKLNPRETWNNSCASKTTSVTFAPGETMKSSMMMKKQNSTKYLNNPDEAYLFSRKMSKTQSQQPAFRYMYRRPFQTCKLTPGNWDISSQSRTVSNSLQNHNNENSSYGKVEMIYDTIASNRKKQNQMQREIRKYFQDKNYQIEDHVTPRQVYDDILRLKNLIVRKDVFNSSVGFQEKVAKVKMDMKELNTIKALDKRIHHFDKDLVRSLKESKFDEH